MAHPAYKWKWSVKSSKAASGRFERHKNQVGSAALAAERVMPDEHTFTSVEVAQMLVGAADFAKKTRLINNALELSKAVDLPRKQGMRIVLAAHEPLLDHSVHRYQIIAAEQARIMMHAKEIDWHVNHFHKSVTDLAEQRDRRSAEDERRAQFVAELAASVRSFVEEAGDPLGFDPQAWTERWLDSPSFSLNGERPSSLLGSPEGEEELREMIGRLRSGAYA